MFQLTKLLYVHPDSIERVEGFFATLCIKITLKDGSAYDRFVSEETIADYAKMDGKRAKEYRNHLTYIARSFGAKPRPFEEVAKENCFKDYTPQGPQEAFESEVAMVRFQIDKAMKEYKRD